MLRNNIKSMFIHIFTGILFWFLSSVLTDMMINWGTSHQYVMNGLFLLISVIGLLFYYAIGKIFLVTQSTNWKALLSVSCVSIIGLFIWICCAFFSDGGWAWFPYLIYNGAFYNVMSIVPSENEWAIIWITFLPSAFLWLGIRKNEQREKKLSEDIDVKVE